MMSAFGGPRRSRSGSWAGLAPLFWGILAILATAATAQTPSGTPEDPFRQFGAEEWPTPNIYRAASGAPGHAYWQQKVDYDISARLDEDARSISGVATIRYRNNSPDPLPYLWLLLDQNIYRGDSVAERSRTTVTDTVAGKVDPDVSNRIRYMAGWRGGFTIRTVTDVAGQPLSFRIADTLMRVDLPRAVAPNGGETVLVVEWSVPLIDRTILAGPSGYECFNGAGQDGNCIFMAGQWFPRLAAYTDYEAWHTQPYLRRGEFTLEFGDYRVALTAPSDHVVAATGVLQNPEVVLSAAQRRRLQAARNAASPMFVVTPDEALAAERARALDEKTWIFAAQNVRDFAWSSSRKFAWDAMGVRQQDEDNPLVMAMSFYPKEARPLWDGLSTRAIAHTIGAYSRWSFPFPYPAAQSVNGPVGGMEYPMISFNNPRPERDPQTGAPVASDRARRRLQSLVIHEVGHNYFPLAVNSDERRWGWMDEGINSFLQYRAEKLWENEYPSLRGEAKHAAEYMASADQQPVMAAPDSVRHFFPNIYVKPAAALYVLRETVLGADVFDQALREYALRWRFKRPTPADFFRTMEESSGTDLDWFWRGWFYSTDHVDLALADVSDERALAGSAAVHLYRFDLRNLGGMIMPIELKLSFADGPSEMVRIPAQVWRYNAQSAAWDYPSDRVLVSAEIDPQHRSADTDRSNNIWRAGK